MRADFPILEEVTYLDSAATSLTPGAVLEAVNEYYTRFNANVHRAIHSMAEEATEKYDEAREKVAGFIGAEKNEVVFTKNCTEALNVAARSLTRDLGPGDNVVVTEMEHHANLVPWQQFAKEKGFELRYVPVNRGVLDLDAAESLIDGATSVVAFCHASNFLGTINPVRELVALAKEAGAITVLDAAQTVPHMPIDVGILGVDFVAFSGHKMLGPTGTGVLYGTRKALYRTEPLVYGGDMIDTVSFEETEFADPPERFEGGTPNVAGAVGLGAAVDYLESFGMEKVRKHSQELVKKALDGMKDLDVEVYGPEERTALVAFNLPRVHPHDVASFLDDKNIAIRTGHHCVMPLHEKMGLDSSCRASFHAYNNEEDVEKLLEALEEAVELFGDKDA